jgi:exosome complex component RRP42
MKTDSMITSVIEQKHILSLLQQNKRLDSRSNFEFRNLEITTNVINKADGSAKVQLGNTLVYAGVKAELGNPFPDTPDQGVLIVNIELNPIASPYFESGPPSKDAIEMSRVCDRAIRESHVVDLGKLCIVPKEKVWIIFVDIYPLTDDGNLLDASTFAAMTALASTKIKLVDVNPETRACTIKEETQPLPISTYATSITFSKIGNTLIVDPSLSEEKVEEGRFTVGVMENGKVSALQKSLPTSFKKEEIFMLIDKAVEIAGPKLEQLKQKIN